MKVLFFIESLRAGGKERRVVELLKEFRNNFPDVEIILTLMRREIHYQEIYQLNVPIYFIERWLIKKDPSVWFRFYWLTRKLNPDIIHVWGHMVAFYAVPAKRLLNIPMINNEITDATPSQRLLGKSWVFNASDKIIANTQAGLLAYGAPPLKSGVIYNGFNFDRLKNIRPPEAVRKQFGITTHRVVGMVATFSYHKDYETFLEAARILLNNYTDITFLCVGEGDYSDLKSKFSDPGILFLGKQNEVESIMNICDIGVLTTNVKNHEEGISNAMLEFMALSKPVIATDSGGSKELIQHGETGFLVKAFDPKEISERIIFLLNHQEECKRIGLQAKERVKKNFSISSMAASFYQQYQMVLPQE